MVLSNETWGRLVGSTARGISWGVVSDCFHLHHFLGFYFSPSVSTPPRPLVKLSFFLSFPLQQGGGESE